MARLLLIGGGHAHCEVLRRLGRASPAHLRTTLVSPGGATAYSGMMPGVIAGHYDVAQCMIPVAALAGRARAAFTRSSVAMLDLERRRAVCVDGTAIEFDLVSIDVGSVPDRSIPGSSVHTLSVKPFARFLDAWAGIREACARGAVRRITVVGGGAGGVELVLAMHHRINAGSPAAAMPRFRLSTDTAELLPTHSPGVRRRFARLLSPPPIEVAKGCRVIEVRPGSLACEDGTIVDSEHVVWAVSASAFGWFRDSGLACDELGFIAVDAHLRSVSHPFVFGAGDCVSQVGFVVPKAGVYAVQQGPVLAANLLRAAAVMASRAGASAAGHATRPLVCAATSAEPPLLRYRPREHPLALITAGNRSAVASRGRLVIAGRWIWRWKDWIDRRFVARYRHSV